MRRGAHRDREEVAALGHVGPLGPGVAPALADAAELDPAGLGHLALVGEAYPDPSLFLRDRDRARHQARVVRHRGADDVGQAVGLALELVPGPLADLVGELERAADQLVETDDRYLGPVRHYATTVCAAWASWIAAISSSLLA